MACDFSSTTADERACGQVVIMHALQAYFSYDLVTMCGFPSITLEGTLDDWRALRAKAEARMQGSNPRPLTVHAAALARHGRCS